MMTSVMIGDYIRDSDDPEAPVAYMIGGGLLRVNGPPLADHALPESLQLNSRVQRTRASISARHLYLMNREMRLLGSFEM